MPKLLIIDAFTLLICEKNVANYALLRCKTFSVKIWPCKIFDKFHVCADGAYHCPVGSCRPFFHIHAQRLHHMLIDLDCRRDKPALFFPGSTSYADDMRIP